MQDKAVYVIAKKLQLFAIKHERLNINVENILLNLFTWCSEANSYLLF